MALSIGNYTIINVVQATHSYGDVRYGTFRGIQCSCMPPKSVTWTSFNMFNLACRINLS